MLSPELRLHIELLGKGLADGQSAPRAECPFCHDKEHTFSVTNRAGGLLFNCYRNTCRTTNRSAGFMRSDGVTQVAAVAPTTPKLNPFGDDLRPPTIAELDELTTRYLISRPQAHNLRVVESGAYKGRIAYPVQGRLGTFLGVILRQRPTAKPDGYPKTLAFVESTKEPFMAWYRSPEATAPGTSVAIVEDQLSAMRLVQAMKCRAVALLGTHMDELKALEIAKEAPNSVAFALDRDAIAKAIDLSTKYSLLYQRTLVIPLQRDIKDFASDVLIQDLFK